MIARADQLLQASTTTPEVEFPPLQSALPTSLLFLSNTVARGKNKSYQGVHQRNPHYACDSHNARLHSFYFFEKENSDDVDGFRSDRAGSGSDSDDRYVMSPATRSGRLSRLKKRTTLHARQSRGQDRGPEKLDLGFCAYCFSSCRWLLRRLAPVWRLRNRRSGKKKVYRSTW